MSMKDSILSQLENTASNRFSHVHKDDEQNRLNHLATHYLNHPELIAPLGDRVYERLHSDLRIQQERIGNPSIGRQ
jgi:hypothetical protein